MYVIFPLCLSRLNWIGVEHSFNKQEPYLDLLQWILTLLSLWVRDDGLRAQFQSHLLQKAPLEVLVRHHFPAWSLVMVFACSGDVLFIPSPGGALPGWNFSGLAMLLKCTLGDKRSRSECTLSELSWSLPSAFLLLLFSSSLHISWIPLWGTWWEKWMKQSCGKH